MGAETASLIRPFRQAVLVLAFAISLSGKLAAE
jgi:hypothetical protein